MQDRFLGRKIAVSDIEKLRTLRHLKMAIQNELAETAIKQDTDPIDILFIKQRLKAVQKTLDKLENYLISMELDNQ